MFGGGGGGASGGMVGPSFLLISSTSEGSTISGVKTSSSPQASAPATLTERGAEAPGVGLPHRAQNRQFVDMDLPHSRQSSPRASVPSSWITAPHASQKCNPLEAVDPQWVQYLMARAHDTEARVMALPGAP